MSSTLEKTTEKGSYTSLYPLIPANSLIMKKITRSFIILNTMMKKERKSFTNISIFFLRSWSYIMAYMTMISGKRLK